jgi:thiol-disulfide isomerase/thioredoxin
VVEEFGGRLAFAVENYGESALAKRFGVARYPAIFVGDVLVATPKDFGFYGKGEGGGTGRYAPFPSARGEELFRADLKRVATLLLAGQAKAARGLAVSAVDEPGGPLPTSGWQDLAGHPILEKDLVGHVVAVEFWATWCVPCRANLSWLGSLSQKYGDRLTVVAVAVQSDADAVKQLAQQMNVPVRWTIGDPELIRQLGDVSAVPTLLLFDRAGHRAGAFYGAPPDLHKAAEARLGALLR